MARAAMNQSAIAKERREMREEQKKQLMDAIPNAQIRSEVRFLNTQTFTLRSLRSPSSLRF